METLKEIAQTLLSGKPVCNGPETFTIKEFRDVNGGIKAVLTSHGYFYTNYEPAQTKEHAIYLALIGLQSMGRFIGYRTEESLQAEITKSKKIKSKSEPKPKIVLDIPEISPNEIPDEPDVQTDTQIEYQEPISEPGSPEEIELRTIIKIVTRVT